MNDPRHGQPGFGGTSAHHPHPQAPQAHPPVTPRPVMPAKPVINEDDLEPIGLDDDDLGPAKSAVASDDPLVANAAAMRGHQKITAFGVSMGGPLQHQWKRTPVNTGKGICRVKSFHGRLSDQGMEYLDSAINEWLDGHPDVDVKAVTTNTNMFDGKTKELALIVNIWY